MVDSTDRSVQVDPMYTRTREELAGQGKVPLDVTPSLEALYQRMAGDVVEEVRRNNGRSRRTVLILPVGPIEQYSLLVRRVNEERLSLRDVTVLNMDEYLASPTAYIAKNHALSFRGFMEREFYGKIDPSLTVPEGQRIFPEPGREGRILQVIEELGGVDLCQGGFGINGHIAFNEPPDAAVTVEAFRDFRTRVLPISHETRIVNSMKIGGCYDLMPGWCISIGMKEILSARKLRFYLNRTWQWGILRKVLFGPVTPGVPASYLQEHADARIVAAAEVVGSDPLDHRRTFMLTIAILGGGTMGTTHALSYENLPGAFRVAAVSDAREEHARDIAKRFGAEACTSSDELLERFTGDAVDICLPTPLHTEYILKALERGLHVFCEKPLALTMEEARRVLDASRKTDRKVMVGHCIRFWPEYLALKRYIDEGTLGGLVSIVFKRIASKRKPGMAWQEWIFDEKKSGSAVIDMHIHDVDYLRFILGEPDRIQAMLYTNRGRAEHVFSNFVYGPVVVNTEASWAYPTGSLPFLMAFTALFEKGVVTFNASENPTFRVFREDTGQWSAPAVERTRRYGPRGRAATYRRSTAT